MASLKALARRPASQASRYVALPAELLYRYSTSLDGERATLAPLPCLSGAMGHTGNRMATQPGPPATRRYFVPA